MGLSDKWEANAADWILWARTPGHDSYWRFHRDEFLGLLPPPGALTVDIGCGEGRLCRDLQRLGHRTVGVDTSPTLIEAARQADPNSNYHLAPAAALPLDAGSVDLAIAFMSLQDIDDLQGAVAECARVLRPGGRLCVAVVHPVNSAGSFDSEAGDSPFVIRGSYLAECDYQDTVERAGLRMTFHGRHRSLETYSRAFEDAGLLSERMREPPAKRSDPISERTKRWNRVPLFLHWRLVRR